MDKRIGFGSCSTTIRGSCSTTRRRSGNIQKRIMVVLGLLEWKCEVTAHDRSGKPDKTSWRMVQLICPHHGETLLDGDAQSVRYGGMLFDRSGQRDKINFQEETDSAIFVMGSDAAEFVKCEVDRKECRTLQTQVKSIQ